MALLTLVLLISIRIADPSFVESIRLRYFDQLITSKESTVSQQVAVVNIDDETIRQKGQFPFPRGEYATIIDTLYRNGAGLVVFNVFLPDSDRFGQDSKLGAILKQHPVVFPHTAVNDQITDSVTQIPFRPGVSIIGEGDPGIKFQSILSNVRSVNENAAGIGIVNTFPELDGVIRRVPMLINIDGKLYPSISLETLRVAAGDPSFQVKINEGSIEAVRVPAFGKITTDGDSRVWVDWSSRPTEYSLANLPKDLGGKIVIVGITGRGLNNPVSTARGEVYPHYLQASVLDTVASGSNISRPDWADGVELLYTILICIITLLLTRFKHGYIFSIIFAAGSFFGSYYLFIGSSYLVDAVFPILTITLVSFHGYVVKFLVELAAKLQIKKQFATYLSPALVEKLQRNPELLQLGGESRELSIMFTDVRGFTSISEHYGKDVQGLTKIMNRYMTAMTAKIIENNGTLDKYIGDAQMAFWNAPLDEPNHAKMAVKTGLEMMGSLDAFNKEVTAEGVPAFGMGLGINTDTVVVGNMGSSQRFDYTCLGDGVNLAARLEGQSKPYGVKIVIGANTNKQVEDEYATLELDCIAVKGKKEGIHVYTVLGRHDWWMENSSYVIETQQHEKMLQLYRLQKFDAAIKLCKQLNGKFLGEMDHYYELWIERCEEMKAKDLPKDWDGVYRATSK
jgi:adenylate cyclase